MPGAAASPVLMTVVEADATGMRTGQGAMAASTDAVVTPYSMNVLQTIKAAQAQHGLRHGDYQRYRRYCTSRLRRLYKSLKFLHGRGKYVKKAIEPAMVTDVRYLLIPLYCAERAWGYAMELKQLPGGPGSRKRFHLIRRLTKAARWGDILSRLCAEKADSRTALEAEAYASWMWGNVKLEREDDWEGALVKFLGARTVYEQLGKVGDMEHQVLCRQRLDELDPSVRYCNYKMGRGKGGDLLEMTRLAMEGPAVDLLQSKLEAVMAEDRARQAASMEELVWQGRRIPVCNAKTRLCILRGQELDKELEVADATPMPLERKLALYDKIFVNYQDAKRHVREDLNVAGGMSAPQEVREALNMLDSAVTTLLLQRTIERNRLLVTAARAKLEKQMQKAKEEKGEKLVRPEDLVRLYDILIQNVTDLADATVKSRRQEDLDLESQCTVKRLLFQACRCFYLAQSYSAASKFAEAYALYRRAGEYSGEGVKASRKCQTLDEAMLWELQDMGNRARAQRCLVHAEGSIQAATLQDGVEKKVADLSLNAAAKGQGQILYLADFVFDKFESAVGSAGTKDAVRLAQIPPHFQSVPCRPIMLDTALSAIDFPSLDHRVKTVKRKGSFFNKFW